MRTAGRLGEVRGVKRSIALAAGVVAAALIAAPVSAGTATGTTDFGSQTPTSGETLYVDVSVKTTAPVVAYEYAIQNECKFPNRTGSSYQHDDIVYWTFEVDGVPHAIMPVYLQSVPQGSSCKVFIVKNNVVVKGSTTSYPVGP
jgi:hypothetical protein